MNKTTSVFFILVGLLLAAAAILKSLHAVSEGIDGVFGNFSWDLP